MVPSLAPGETAEVTIMIRPCRRGRYRIKQPICQSSFPFNVFSFGVSRRRDQTLTVLPAFYRLPIAFGRRRRHVHSGGAGFAGRREVSPEYAGNRPFLPGDSPRRIDVRAWARLSVPATKEYHNNLDSYTALILDTRIPKSLQPSSANAIQEAERVEKLAERRAVSQQHRDQLITAASVARARVAQAAARVARAERDLRLTLVVAPYAGSIVQRLAHEGAMTDSGPIVVLQESSTLEAILDIPEASPAPVRVGDVVRLYAEGLAEPLGSRVDRVNPRIDAQTRTYEVRAPVVDPSGTVKAGSYVRAEIVLAPAEPRPIVDRSALLMRDGRRYVFRVVDDRVERRPVRVGVMDARSVQILSGVEDGDEVVRGDAVEHLTDGARVRSAEARIGAVSGRPAPETLP